MTQARLGGIENLTTPACATGLAVELLPGKTLTQDGDDNLSSIYSVKDGRKVGLWINYDGDGSATAAGDPYVFVALSAQDDPDIVGDPPALDDDFWYAPVLVDSTPTDAVVADGYIPTLMTWTGDPEFRFIKAGAMIIGGFKTNANDDKIRLFVPINVELARWMVVWAVDNTSGGANEGTISIDWNMSF
jgi:hypothetical protein